MFQCVGCVLVNDIGALGAFEYLGNGFSMRSTAEIGEAEDSISCHVKNEARGQEAYRLKTF